ncbi:MAG: MBL fold metallo-hydrolase [Cryomorphaceae bacterium]|nr:MBL fold metallo-hydrolase [Cryomorphaceae bacterium]
MTLEFLGTGTSQGVPVIGCHCKVCSSSDPRDNRFRSSVLIKTNHHTIIIDAGPDLRMQLLCAKLDAPSALLLTHNHQDHTAGLDDLRPIIHKNDKAFPIYCEEATELRLRKQYDYAFEENLYPGAPRFEMHRIRNQPFKIGKDLITPIRAQHGNVPVLGFRIGNISYLTDAKTISHEETEKMFGSKILVLNALRHEEHHSHLNLKQAVALAEKIGAEKTYFTHISHHLGKHEEVEKNLPKGMFLSFDGLMVNA